MQLLDAIKTGLESLKKSISSADDFDDSGGNFPEANPVKETITVPTLVKTGSLKRNPCMLLKNTSHHIPKRPRLHGSTKKIGSENTMAIY